MLRFERQKRPGLLGLTIVYTEVGEDGGLLDAEQPFEIRADSGGLRFLGASRRISEMADLDILAKTISEAWSAHRGLRPKVTSITGH